MAYVTKGGGFIIMQPQNATPLGKLFGSIQGKEINKITDPNTVLWGTGDTAITKATIDDYMNVLSEGEGTEVPDEWWVTEVYLRDENGKFDRDFEDKSDPNAVWGGAIDE